MKSSIIKKASGKKPPNKVPRIAKMFREKVMDLHMCEICGYEYNIEAFSKIAKC